MASASDRAEKWMEITYDHQQLILLLHNHEFVTLYAKHIHSNYDHMVSEQAQNSI